MLFEKENTEEIIIKATFNIVQKEGVQQAWASVAFSVAHSLWLVTPYLVPALW